jgi:hypothetical protein
MCQMALCGWAVALFSKPCLQLWDTAYSCTTLPGSFTPCRLPLHKPIGRHGGERVVEIVYSFGLLYSYELIVGRRLPIPRVYYYVIALFFVLLNYLLAYRDGRLYNYYENRLTPRITIAVIVLGYLFMGVTGYLYRQLYFWNVYSIMKPSAGVVF